MGGPDTDPVLAPNVVNAHSVDGRIAADQLRPGLSLRSRSGDLIEVVAKPDGRLALRSGPGGFSIGARLADAHVVQPDIGCSNGVVHRIDDVLVR